MRASETGQNLSRKPFSGEPTFNGERLYLEVDRMPHNKRMQTDQSARYAHTLAADAGR